jgi:hypothetical protein
MAEQTFNIEFDGYWREGSISGIPPKSGVYCMYECTYNKENDTVTLHKLLYVGEALNVKEAVVENIKTKGWKASGDGNELCFSFANIEPHDRNRVAAAIINNKKPDLNDEYKNNFPFDTTTINASGRTNLINTFFTVDKGE